MEELKEALEQLSKRMIEATKIIEVAKKFPYDKDVAGLLFKKEMEDGLIKNFCNASVSQLVYMKTNYYWKYYQEDVMFSHKPDKRIENIIDDMILCKKREQKLERILKGV